MYSGLNTGYSTVDEAIVTTTNEEVVVSSQSSPTKQPQPQEQQHQATIDQEGNVIFSAPQLTSSAAEIESEVVSEEMVEMAVPQMLHEEQEASYCLAVGEDGQHYEIMMSNNEDGNVLITGQ